MRLPAGLSAKFFARLFASQSGRRSNSHSNRHAFRQAHGHFLARAGWKNYKPGALLHGVAGFVRVMCLSVRHSLQRPFSFWQDRVSVRVLRVFAASVAVMAVVAIILTAMQSLSGGMSPPFAQPSELVATKATHAPKPEPARAPTALPERELGSAPANQPEATAPSSQNWPDFDTTSGMESSETHPGGPERRGTLAAMSSLNLEEGLRDSISDGNAYNESEEAPLADVARQVDAALLQTLARFNLEGDALDLLHSETRFTEDNLVYPFLRLRVSLQDSSSTTKDQGAQHIEFANSLADALTVWAPAARLHREGHGLLLVAVDRVVTHSILLPITDSQQWGSTRLPSKNSVSMAAENTGTPLPTLVIIIDDMGEDLKAARTLLDLPFPVTFSVWPRARWTNYIATLAHERGGQVFLHQPMQPLQSGENMGQGGLRVSMNASEMTNILRSNMRLVPNVAGVNNHMGSRFTSSKAAVRLFCQSLHSLRPDIMVLDSLTHGASVLYDESRAQGFASFRRALFLDDVRGKDAILMELDHGMELARRDGQAIVIGHPRSDTLAALLAWRGYLADDVAIVPLAPRPDNTNGGKSVTYSEIP